MTPRSLFSVMLLVSAGLCELSSPINSTRFIHMLTWDGGPNSTNGLCYTVKYHNLNSAIAKTVSECECVRLPVICNLTEAFSDIDAEYYTEIFAILGNRTSSTAMFGPFIPKDDTLLDPPLIFLSRCNNSMCVNLKPPTDSLRSVYEKFTYTLTIVSTKNGFQFFKETTGLKVSELPNLEPDTQYCVTVSIKDRKNVDSRTECNILTLLYNPEKQIANVGFGVLFLVCFPLFFIFKICHKCLVSKPPFPNSLKSVKSHNVLLFSSGDDIPACSKVLVKDSINAISQSKNDKEKSNGEDNGEQAVTGTKKSIGNYERWTEQMDCCTQSMDNSSSTFPPVSPPSDMTENRSLSKFTVSQSESSSVTGSEDISFKCQSNAHITNQHSQNHCVRELGSRPVFQFGFKISESMINEQEEEDTGSCPDINLLSVTLGKHEEEKPEEQGNEDNLQGSCPHVNLSVTLGKHGEEKPEEQENEDNLQGSCPHVNLSVTLGKHEEEKPEEQGNEDNLQGSCPDINLLSVTLGKHGEEKPEEQENEDNLQGSCPHVNLSVTLGKHGEEKPEEQENEDNLQGSCPHVNLSVTLGKHGEEKPEEEDNEDTLLLDSLWRKGGDSSLPFRTDAAGSSDSETYDTECSEYLKRLND